METTQELALATYARTQADRERMARTECGELISKGGVAFPFPWRLHECLDVMSNEGLEDIISWNPHGRSFAVRKPKQFVELIMPRFFNQTKYGSFQRQLNIYGFCRLSSGKDKGAYYHFSFVRGYRSLVRDMVRYKIKGCKRPDGGRKSRERPTQQPNFYHPSWKNHFEHSIPPGGAIQLRRGPGKPLSVSPRIPSTSTSIRVVPSRISSNSSASMDFKDDDLPLLETSSAIQITPECADISIDSYNDEDHDDTSILSQWETEIPMDDLCQHGSLALFRAEAEIPTDDLFQVGSLALFRIEPCLPYLHIATSGVPLEAIVPLHPNFVSNHSISHLNF